MTDQTRLADDLAAFAILMADDDGANDGSKDGEGDSQIGVATKTRTKPKKPSQYKVLLLNDDYTPMEFVVMVLKRFFKNGYRSGNAGDAACPPKGCRHLRRLLLRSGRNQGQSGDGLRQAEPAPAAMHARKSVNAAP